MRFWTVGGFRKVNRSKRRVDWTAQSVLLAGRSSRLMARRATGLPTLNAEAAMT